MAELILLNSIKTLRQKLDAIEKELTPKDNTKSCKAKIAAKGVKFIFGNKIVERHGDHTIISDINIPIQNRTYYYNNSNYTVKNGIDTAQYLSIGTVYEKESGKRKIISVEQPISFSLVNQIKLIPGTVVETASNYIPHGILKSVCCEIENNDPIIKKEIKITGLPMIVCLEEDKYERYITGNDQISLPKDASFTWLGKFSSSALPCSLVENRDVVAKNGSQYSYRNSEVTVITNSETFVLPEATCYRNTTDYNKKETKFEDNISLFNNTTVDLLPGLKVQIPIKLNRTVIPALKLTKMYSAKCIKKGYDYIIEGLLAENIKAKYI